MWGHWSITIDHGDAATWFLGIVTALLAIAAWRALGQLRVALDQLKVAIDQLEEIKRDRHVQVFSDMGARWARHEMAESLQMECDYTARSLLRRVPNYFEEAATIAKVGSLKPDLMDE